VLIFRAAPTPSPARECRAFPIQRPRERERQRERDFLSRQWYASGRVTRRSQKCTVFWAPHLRGSHADKGGHASLNLNSPREDWWNGERCITECPRPTGCIRARGFRHSSLTFVLFPLKPTRFVIATGDLTSSFRERFSMTLSDDRQLFPSARAYRARRVQNNKETLAGSSPAFPRQTGKPTESPEEARIGSEWRRSLTSGHRVYIHASGGNRGRWPWLRPRLQNSLQLHSRVGEVCYYSSVTERDLDQFKCAIAFYGSPLIRSRRGFKPRFQLRILRAPRRVTVHARRSPFIALYRESRNGHARVGFILETWRSLQRDGMSRTSKADPRSYISGRRGNTCCEGLTTA